MTCIGDDTARPSQWPEVAGVSSVLSFCIAAHAVPRLGHIKIEVMLFASEKEHVLEHACIHITA